MRRNLVAGNWKMNGDRAMAAALCASIVDGLARDDRVEVALCPPHILIPAVVAATKDSDISVGAQDLDANADGAFTGQVSARMIGDSGCRYVIVGHSERRAMYHESDQVVGDKAKTALAAGLRPIICVGESQAQRDAGDTEKVVARQLDAVLDATIGDGGDGGGDFDGAVIAYEPVWAIGTGATATPAQAQSVHRFIRARLAARNADAAQRCRILYGGSMKPTNAAELIAEDDIDGGLIGGASLNADDFLAICAAARA